MKKENVSNPTIRGRQPVKIEIDSAYGNIFVLGDLVTDHLIEVKQKASPYQKVGDEQVYVVSRRITIAGGAANCARILCALGVPRVSLWGLAGYSPWGPFRQVLANSHAIDGADTQTTLYAEHEESQQMNTITRIIDVSDNLHRDHKARFDDTRNRFPTTSDFTRAIDHLDNEHKRHEVSAIVLNDLDMGALDQTLIRGVQAFSKKHDIPLFIDPKRDWKKYADVQAKCVLPNLKEWLHIVGDLKDLENDEKEREFRAKIDNPAYLTKIAIQSIRHMPKVDFHVIKCDRLGAIVIAPGDDSCVIYRIHPAVPTSHGQELPHQLGTGDALSAVIAVEYATRRKRIGKNAIDKNADCSLFLDALKVANAVVGQYVRMPFHHMPNRLILRDARGIITEPIATSKCGVGILYLPEPRVRLSEYESPVKALIGNEQFRQVISSILNTAKSAWSNSEAKSLIVTGPGGSGKSELIKELDILLKPIGKPVIYLVNVPGRETVIKGTTIPVEKIPKSTDAILKIAEKYKSKFSCDGLLFAIDEAFKDAPHLTSRMKGVTLLESGHRAGIRFLFVDANYDDEKKNLDSTQFITRCHDAFRIPGLAHRPSDIPLLFAKTCLSVAGQSKIRISHRVLVAVIDWILALPAKERSVRTLLERAKEVGKAARPAKDHPSWLEISASALREPLLRFDLTETVIDRDFVEFES